MRTSQSFVLMMVLVCLFLFFHVQAATAAVRAYILLEAAATQTAIESSTGSFLNCKPLFNRIFSGEYIVHLHCNEMEDLHKAMKVNLSKAEGVSGITILRIVR